MHRHRDTQGTGPAARAGRGWIGHDAQHRTLTHDRGVEMACHAQLAQACGIDIYFADPHSPWQRPTNENGNGLVRRYVGASTDLAACSPDDLRAIEHRINTMTRHIHSWSTAHDVYTAAAAMTG